MTGIRPITIGYLVASLRVGGAERQMLALAAGLPRDRFRPEFLSMSGPGPLDAEAREAGISVSYLGSRPVSGARLPAMALGRISKLAAYVRDARSRRLDIVDAWLYPEDLVAVLTRFGTRTPVVLSGRRDVQPRGRIPVISRAVDVAVARLADAVVANSAAVGAHAVTAHHVPGHKLHVIRNGVAPIPSPTEEERAALRRSMGAGPGDHLIGCVGNLREVKRHALLLDAFAALAHDRPDLRLVLVGDGPLRETIERQAARLGLHGRVRLHGSVPDARPLYAAFDLVVQASSSEGLPNVLLEASAAGRPIVATAAGGSNEIVIDGETGLLVPVEDARALATAMRRALEHPELCERLGASAQHHIATAFGMDRFIREWADLYERSLATARA